MRGRIERLRPLGLVIVVLGFTLGALGAQDRGSGSTDANKALVRRYFEELNKGDFTAIDRLFDRDYVFHSPGIVAETMGYQPGVDLVGTRATAVIKLRAIALRENFLNGVYRVEDQVAEGDKVVTRWVFRGKPKRGEARVNPAIKTVAMTTIEIDRILGGRIVASWDLTNIPSLKIQLDHF